MDPVTKIWFFCHGVGKSKQIWLPQHGRGVAWGCAESGRSVAALDSWDMPCCSADAVKASSDN
jgi:hypothetical protein